LYIQAALSAIFPLSTVGRDGMSWVLVGFALAAACLGVSYLVHQGKPSARAVVIGFEVVAVAVGALALVAHHYVPGSAIGAWTLFAVLSSRASVAPPAPVPAPAPQPVANPVLVPQQEAPTPQAEAPVTAMAQAVPSSARNILPGK